MTADGQTLMQRAIEWAAEEVSGVETGDIYVNEIAMGGRKSGLFYYAQATVWIKDDTGADVAGVTVVVQWSGAVGGQSEGQTGVDGKVMLESAGVKNGGTYTCTVSGVSKLGWTYNPGLNVETSDSIMLP
ncbi:MAG: hypothetical protein KKI02_05735 [Planctomycetes bacterium]|nr:hypothetical protein [Planctomycetota bacterium]